MDCFDFFERENGEEPFRFSYSKLTVYTICPKKYEHTYVLRSEPSHRPLALAFGSAFHNALARHYLRIAEFGEGPPIEEAEENFIRDWQSEVRRENMPKILFDDRRDEKAAQDMGAALLRLLCQREEEIIVRGVEVPFELGIYDDETGELLPIRFAGFIDLIAEKEGRAVIIEHKTASRKPSEETLRYSHQPTIYKLAAEALGEGEAGLTYQFFIQTKTPKIELYSVERDGLRREEFFDTMIKALRGIKAGAFYRNRGWACNSCQYGYLCG